MTRFGLIVAVLATMPFVMATAAEAGPKAKKDHFAIDGCPPGLAKKDPPCVPPGQVGKNHVAVNPAILGTTAVIIHNADDVLTGDYILLVNPQIYRPDLNAVYVRYGDYLYLMDRDQALVLDRLGPVSDWTWVWADTDFANCPPGLAKKNPPCVPPGLAKKGVTVRAPGQTIGYDPYGIGDRLPDDHVILMDPQLYTPNDNAQFVRSGDTLYRIDSATGLVLDVIGQLADLLR